MCEVLRVFISIISMYMLPSMPGVSGVSAVIMPMSRGVCSSPHVHTQRGYRMRRCGSRAGPPGGGGGALSNTVAALLTMSMWPVPDTRYTVL